MCAQEKLQNNILTDWPLIVLNIYKLWTLGSELSNRLGCKWRIDMKFSMGMEKSQCVSWKLRMMQHSEKYDVSNKIIVVNLSTRLIVWERNFFHGFKGKWRVYTFWKNTLIFLWQFSVQILSLYGKAILIYNMFWWYINVFTTK